MPHVDCWISRTAFASLISRCHASEATSSQRRIWCRGVLGPWNLLPSTVPSWVRSLQFLRLDSALPPLLDAGTPKAPFPDLSRASKLKDLTFVCTASDVSWITAALQTVEPGNLQQITIILRREPQGDATERTIPRQRWQNLDRLLVQLCTSYSIRPRLVYTPDIGPGANRRTLGSLLCPGEDTRERDTRDYVLNLLPELANRGLVRLVQRTPPSTRTTAR